MAKMNAVPFLFNLQKRIDLARKDWPSVMTYSFLPAKSLFKTYGSASSGFTFFKVTDILSTITKDPVTDKEAFASELTVTLDSIVYGLESLAVKILSGQDESDFKAKRNFNGNPHLLNNAVGPALEGLPMIHLLYDFTSFLVITINNNKVILGISVDGTNNVSSAYFIVQ